MLTRERVIKELNRLKIVILLLCVFTISFINFSFIFAQQVNNINSSKILPVEVIDEPEPYSSFFIYLLENPFTSTILSAFIIGAGAYVVAKIRSITQSVSTVKEISKTQPQIIEKLEKMDKKIDDKDAKLNEQFEHIDKKFEIVHGTISDVKKSVDDKIWDLLMTTSGKKEDRPTFKKE